MSEASPASGEPFDLQKLQQLFELMEKHDLSEVNLKNGPEHIRLRRGSSTVTVAAPAPTYLPAPAAPVASAPAAAAPAASAPAAPAAEAGLIDIKSPTVGTFYTSPTPEDPAFVNVGSTVGPQTVVCIIEAMKVFNQIPAEVSGTIAAVLVKNGDPVEYGQPLFRVRP
ncbi:acetyl-CoA carboxylase biotin carboxyl carrier protein [Planctopirus hydrillae]|uniref:Biotin carboxyl carrier protein of acetyl-CoA carboxylase n=1 Tax=Planctopirus hydrillae TaxID=1841610 RepID=A0A1C3EN93_9PLAN|nr:acetyl-CoA carboxylase biotin carboxyl carrier protein [Planctopirus hydrillae]ODA34695.1 acetyl-CoA carboxylase, biotin carboxyl carrier protein [Planctopirus hydrillae]